jgi:autotransporter-associated beta strand protein
LYSLQINNAVSGAGNFNKTGAGVVQLNAATIHTGATIISAGTLTLGPAATLSPTPAIAIAGGAVLDVASLSGGFVLSAAQTLTGNGTVIGSLLANGTVSPGASVGRLTISGNARLAGNTLMELAKSGAALTNDVLSVAETLTCGGTLSAAHTGAALAEGDSFRLFSAGALAGSFASLSLPALDPGLAWDVSTLNTDGWLRVVVSNNAPVIGSIGIIGSSIVITGSGGTPGASYFVLTATNVALPLPQWTAVATNDFDANGHFAFTNTIVPANGRQFFRLLAP